MNMWENPSQTQKSVDTVPKVDDTEQPIPDNTNKTLDESTGIKTEVRIEEARAKFKQLYRDHLQKQLDQGVPIDKLRDFITTGEYGGKEIPIEDEFLSLVAPDQQKEKDKIFSELEDELGIYERKYGFKRGETKL
jgi:hypothetical protein